MTTKYRFGLLFVVALTILAFWLLRRSTVPAHTDKPVISGTSSVPYTKNNQTTESSSTGALAAPSSEPEPSPGLLITEISTTHTANTLTYTSKIKNSMPGMLCSLSLTDESSSTVIKKAARSTNSGCAGSLTDTRLKPGTTWHVTLIYDSGTSQASLKKIVEL